MSFPAQRRAHRFPQEPNEIGWAPVNPPGFGAQWPIVEFPIGTIFSFLRSSDNPPVSVFGLSNIQADGFRYFVNPIVGAQNFPLGEQAAGPDNSGYFQGGSRRRSLRSKSSKKAKHSSRRYRNYWANL